MKIQLLTIGFTQKSAEQFFGLLADAGVARVLDIRENRGGQLSGFAKEQDLRYFLPQLIGAEYDVEPLLAPSPAIREAYKATKDWDAYEHSFMAMLAERRAGEHIRPERFDRPTALLCSEPTPEKCHRRLVAEYFAALWRPIGHEVDIRHLVLPKVRRKTHVAKRTRESHCEAPPC
jgi:uncharacterized protein (DUF488 family)